MTTKRFMTMAAIAAVTAGVFGTGQAALAYTDDAVKRAIVTIVLKNLGVEPSSSIVDAIVADLPLDALSTNLVDEVGAALDAGDDPTLIVGQTVDSDGDGVPNENGALDSESDDFSTDDDSDNDDGSDDDNSGSTVNGGGGDDDSDNEDDDSDESDEGDSEHSEDSEDPDN